MPPSNFEGTPANPFILPCFSRVTAHKSHEVINLWSYDGAEGRFISSDPSVVEVIDEDCFVSYLNPVGPGVCTITYIEGAYTKKVTVRSEPGALEEVGYTGPGFYTYYGSAHVRRDNLSLSDGLPIVMALEPHPYPGSGGKLELDRFQFSTSGVVRVELLEGYTFSLVPMEDGVTTLTYTTQSGQTYPLAVSVGLPEPVWDFVVPDDTVKSGYRLWQGERAAVGDRLEQEGFFAQLVLAEDGSILTVRAVEPPEDLAVEAQDAAAFDLVRRGTSLFACAAPRMEGEYALTVTATPPGASEQQTWVKHLYSSLVIAVTENTVAAINEAIRTAPLKDGYETVILLPKGYIPMDGDTPVLLNRPVALRGQEDTVLASDVAALSHVPGAKLQNLTIRFDDTSTYSGSDGFRTRLRYPSTVNLYINNIDLNRLLYAIMGDGMVTLENCELDGGPPQNRCQYGIAVAGNGVAFQGANTIRNFSEAGWKLYSMPGPRRYFRGLTFAGNGIGVSVECFGSTDPYFVRLIESNFIDNGTNIASDFPVNFSHNFFSGGIDNAGGAHSADKTDADDGTAPFADSIRDTAVVPNQSPLAPFLEERQYHTTGNGDGVSEFVEILVDEKASGNAGLAAFTYPPAPPGGIAAPQTISANRYVDDTAIRTAFGNPRHGQVVIDVSVRTAVSPLAFQLLTEPPELTLVRFTGWNVRDEATQNAFDTSVNWIAAQEEGYARLSFQQQGELPGSCVLILETATPHGWAAYNPSRYHYMPCTLNVRQQGTRMQMNLDALGEYVALL